MSSEVASFSLKLTSDVVAPLCMLILYTANVQLEVKAERVVVYTSVLVKSGFASSTASFPVVSTYALNTVL